MAGFSNRYALGDYAPAAPTVTEGFFVKPEVRVLVGTSTLWGSLERISYSYNYYATPIGLLAGQSFDVGALASIEPVLNRTFEAVDAANLPAGRLYDLTSEEVSLSLTVMEMKPQLVDLLLATTGVTYSNQYMWALGGACVGSTRPISIEWTNVNCGAPTSANISTGISGGILTIFDGMVTSGLNFGAMARNGQNNYAITIVGRPVLSMPAGKRLCSLWLY
jgi:hypothetical protein